MKIIQGMGDKIPSEYFMLDSDLFKSPSDSEDELMVAVTTDGNSEYCRRCHKSFPMNVDPDASGGMSIEESQTEELLSAVIVRVAHFPQKIQRHKSVALREPKYFCET